MLTLLYRQINIQIKWKENKFAVDVGPEYVMKLRLSIVAHIRNKLKT